ncbi:hypothetical protein LJC74_07985 [Eubacteriales bacterium OttesenSCG-928-A19]|nr:hypothetical protein [Eubacteriales bacterium OttesenSCG-928-A19]
MYPQSTHAYIFAAPVSHGYVPYGNLKKACDPATEEHRYFVNGALSYEERDLTPGQITIVTPERWLPGVKISPMIEHSSDACALVSRRAKDYLLRAGLVDDPAALEALDDSISLDNHYRIVYIVYIIDTEAKKVIKKK